MNMYKHESLKTSLNINIYATNYINDLIIRKYAIDNKIHNKEKIKILSEHYKIDKSLIRSSYEDDLEYIYDTIISYFIAIELFEIYIKDKEKCIYLCNKLITDKKNLTTKLNIYNINLLENNTKYIKTLKKEYETINNL